MACILSVIYKPEIPMKNILFLLPAALLLASCGGDEIETYQVPKEKPATPPMQVQAPAQQQAPAASHAHSSSPGFSAELPDGWKEVPSTSAMRKVSYGIDGTEIDAYFITLSMGDVLSNVNRWERQVGLPPSSLADIEKDMIEFSINSHPCKYFEIYNEEGGKGIIAGIIDLAPMYWYFTGKGPVDELKAHTADMQAFLQSMKFDGHNH